MLVQGRIRHGLVFLMLLSICSLVFSDNVHASIKNKLGSGRSLTIHCRSKDDDLGQHDISDGDEIGWDFSPNVWGTTLFYCNLSWLKVPDYHFDAYSYGRDYIRCQTQCSWLIAEEGIYGLNSQTGFWEYMFSWPN